MRWEGFGALWLGPIGEDDVSWRLLSSMPVRKWDVEAHGSKRDYDVLSFCSI